MDRIPGLDILNASGDGHISCGINRRGIFEGIFPIPANFGNMRSEGDFNYTVVHDLFAQVQLVKAHDSENSSKEISLVIYDEPQDPDAELTDILQELEIITELDHNNVLKFYETIAGSKITDVAFVFEPHDSLLSEIIENKIEKLYEPPVIKKLMQDLFTALDYLHQNRIIHRDIQPENILFTSTGVLKVWNFRNAQRVGRKAKKLIVRDFRYQSLDLLLGFEKYDEAVDVWSANIIFLQLWLKRSFFPKHGRELVLQNIFRLLGFPRKYLWEEFFTYPGINDMEVYKVAEYNMLNTYLRKHCDRVVSPKALDLLHRCFRYNPKHRPKAEYCLLHPYFQEEPKACPVEEIVIILDHATICDQLRAMKDKKSI